MWPSWKLVKMLILTLIIPSCVRIGLPCEDDTDVKPEDQKRIADSIHEYANFINAIENNRVRRKAESQLGRKAIQLRQVLSVDQFSVDFYPVACDQLVIPRKTTKSQPDPQ